MRSLLLRATLVLLGLDVTRSVAQQPLPSLQRIQGTDAATATEYTRILLPGHLLSHTLASVPASLAPTGAPTLIAQCTRQPVSGKLAFELFLHFGEVTDLDFHAPVPPSPTHPRPRRVDLTESFSGYRELKPLKFQWELLNAPAGMLRYNNSGLHSANLEDASTHLRYLLALPHLRVSLGPNSAIFDATPLLADIRSEPICKAALL